MIQICGSFQVRVIMTKSHMIEVCLWLMNYKIRKHVNLCTCFLFCVLNYCLLLLLCCFFPQQQHFITYLSEPSSQRVGREGFNINSWQFAKLDLPTQPALWIHRVWGVLLRSRTTAFTLCFSHQGSCCGCSNPSVIEVCSFKVVQRLLHGASRTRDPAAVAAVPLLLESYLWHPCFEVKQLVIGPYCGSS